MLKFPFQTSLFKLTTVYYIPTVMVTLWHSEPRLPLTTKAQLTHTGVQTSDTLCIKTKALVGPIQQFMLEAVVGEMHLPAEETGVSSVSSHVTGEHPNFSGQTSDKI